jgi:hypothetical protein
LLNGVALRNGFEAAPKVRKNRFEYNCPRLTDNVVGIKSRQIPENKTTPVRDLSPARHPATRRYSSVCQGGARSLNPQQKVRLCNGSSDIPSERDQMQAPWNY